MRRHLLPAAVLVACSASGGWAQQVGLAFPLPPVQLTFAPPGARSLGMGGTFTALADDATASESNPAGLTILTKPEVSFHVRSSSFDNRGSNVFTGETITTDSSTTAPAFASVVYPMDEFAVAVYYQRAAFFRNETAFSAPNQPVPGFPGLRATGNVALRSDLVIDNFGLSGAYKVSPQVSIGGSIRATRFKLDDSFRLSYSDATGELFAQNDRNNSSVKPTFNVGVLVTPTKELSLGAVYKLGGKNFDMESTLSTGFIDRINPGRSINFPAEVTPEEFTLPNTFSAGIAYRATERLTISADIVNIQYSKFRPARPDDPQYIPYENATEVHGGAEYTFFYDTTPISLRAGVYTEPDYDGERGIKEKQTHFTFGGGVVLSERFQIDAAANLSDTLKEGLVSMVVRF